MSVQCCCHIIAGNIFFTETVNLRRIVRAGVRVFFKRVDGVDYFYKKPPKRCKMRQKNGGLKIGYSVSFRFKAT